jgi:hypothetical protein
MDGPMTQSADQQLEQGDAKRHAARESIFLAAQLRIPPEASPISARVRNISPGGMMVDYAGKVSTGTRLMVEVKGVGPIDGKVAWVAGGRLGIAFDEEIDPQLARVKGPDVDVDPRYKYLDQNLRRPGLSIR